MQNFDVMIVDDEPRVVNFLGELVAADPECNVVLATTNPNEAIVYEAEHPVDLAIVDIEMGPHNGLDLVRNFSADTYSMVCTGHHDLGDPSLYAGAMDFFTKPFEPDRFYFSLARFKENRGQAKQYWRDNPAPPHLIVPLIGAPGAERIPVDDILYVYVDNEKATLVMRNGATRPVGKSMQRLELMLAIHGFLRIHRAYLANMGYALVFHRTKKPKLTLNAAPAVELPGCEGNQLPIGRKYKAGVELFFADASR